MTSLSTWEAGGVLPEKLGGGVRPTLQNPYPTHDQNVQYSLPYLWPEPHIKILFQTCILIGPQLQTNVKLP